MTHQDTYLLTFPPGFRWFGAGVTLVGAGLWLLLYFQWRAAGGTAGLTIDSFLVVQLFLFPFGLGLLVWSSQRIVVGHGAITSNHLGRRNQLDRISARVQRRIASGVYLKDLRGKRLFVSQWLRKYGRLVEECSH